MTTEEIKQSMQELESQKLLNEAHIQNLIKENEQIAVLLHIGQKNLEMEEALLSHT